MSARDPGDVDVDEIVSSFEDDSGDGGSGGGGVDAGGFGQELGGDPAGTTEPDADQDPDPTDTGPGPGGTGIPGAPSDQQPDTSSGGGDTPPSDPTPDPDLPPEATGIEDRDPVRAEPTPAEDPQDIINLTSTDPRFRGDLFRDPAQQISFTEQFEQRLRQRFGDPSIVLDPGEIGFEEIDDGRFRGTVGSGTLLRSESVRQQARQGFEREFERSIGRDVELEEIELEPVPGGVQGGLSEQAIRRFQQDQLELARDLIEAEGAVSTVGMGASGLAESPLPVSSIGRAERGGDPFLEFTGEAESNARRRIREQFESELGVDISESDIEFEREDGRLVGTLTSEAQQEIQVQQEPLVQVTQDTPLEQPFETGGRIGARQAAQRARRRERLFGAIGQRERAEQLIEDIGLGDELGEFRSLQTSAQAELASLRQSTFQAGRRGLTIAAAPVALPLGAALNQADVPPSALEGLPSPTEEPVGFAAAAAPVAIAEPSPVGEVAVGTAALVGGAALAAQRQREQATPADLQAAAEADLEPTLEVATATAMAEPPGLFIPEQEQPTEPIGRGFFQPDFPIGPSRQELPELLPPTDPQSNIQTGRLTRPELEVPEEPAVDPFPAEVPTPQEPTGEGLFPPEQEVPTVEARPQQIGRQRERLRQVDDEISRAIEQMQTTEELRRRRRRSLRSRQERRRQEQIEDILESDFPSPRRGEPPEPTIERTIEERMEIARERRGEGREEFLERLREIGEPSVEPGGLQFIVRPDPTSMDLRRIRTEEGEFVVEPELTRFLEAAELEQVVEPELELTEEGATLPPAQDVAAELAALEATGELTAQREAAALTPLEDTLLGVDTAAQVDERLRVGMTPQQAQAELQRTETATRAQTISQFQGATGTAEEGIGASFEAVFEEPNVPRFFEEFPLETVPTDTTIEGLDLELPPGEMPDDRRRDEEFERQFEFEVLEPLEALGATPDLDAGELDQT